MLSALFHVGNVLRSFGTQVLPVFLAKMDDGGKRANEASRANLAGEEGWEGAVLPDMTDLTELSAYLGLLALLRPLKRKRTLTSPGGEFT